MTELYASGGGWVGRGVGSVETALHRVFNEAKFRIAITAYSVSGPWELLPGWIRSATDRGVEVLAVVNRLHDQLARSQLLQLASERSPSFSLYDFSGPEGVDLHAKIFVADEEMALIGSSNFSARGLIHNYELAVLVRGEAARKSAELVHQLTTSRYVTRYAV